MCADFNCQLQNLLCYFKFSAYLLNKTGLDLQEVTINSFVHEAFPGHLLEVGSVQPLLIEKILFG